MDTFSVNWGIISTGRISNDFCNALNNCKGAIIKAVGASSKDKAAVINYNS